MTGHSPADPSPLDPSPVDLSAGDRNRLLGVLTTARQLGFLGPGDLLAQVSHSLAFVALCGDSAGLAIDLGSGGGLPGLVLALAAPVRSWILLDANHRRTAFLADMVAELGLGSRVRVICQRAEEAGRSSLRGAADLIVARGFAAPGPTAECAAPLLRQGGALIVSEPPGAPQRWPTAGLATVGLQADTTVMAPVALRRFLQVEPCPDRYPAPDRHSRQATALHLRRGTGRKLLLPCDAQPLFHVEHPAAERRATKA